MITSALISQCRREYDDLPKSTRVAREGNGVINIFNVAKFPVIESSQSIYVANTLRAASGYTSDLDNGDLTLVTTPSNGQEVRSEHKYATWRDRHWVEALNQGIENLNARGFFRQVVRESRYLSAGVRSFSGPTNAVDVYELLYQTSPTSSPVDVPFNWSYQQDANKIVVGNAPTTKLSGSVSYLRNLRTYSATSATVDVLDDWLEVIKKKAGAIFYRHLAGKIAKQGNATIDEGHFSFTNLRTMANDLDQEFERLALRKKPTRPAKDIQRHQELGGKI